MLTAVRSTLPLPEVGLAASGLAVSAPLPGHYRFADLGCHSDGSPFLPVAINDRDEIAVTAAGRYPLGVVRGFCISGALRTPAGLAFGQEPVTCLNHDGLGAGAVGTGPRALRAWAAPLGIFGEQLWPGSVSIARGLNRRGQIVGDVLFDAGDFTLSRAFLLTGPGLVRCLTPPSGGTTTAIAINDTGDVVFNARPLGASRHETQAWCLSEDRYLPIAGLGGGYAWATALTAGGRVAGRSFTAGGATHAFWWEDGATTDLGTLPGWTSEAIAANDQRTVVGRLLDARGQARAFHWSPEGGLAPLDDLVALPEGWQLHEARGINARGVIVGRGTWRGVPRGFILHPRTGP